MKCQTIMAKPICLFLCISPYILSPSLVDFYGMRRWNSEHITCKSKHKYFRLQRALNTVTSKGTKNYAPYYYHHILPDLLMNRNATLYMILSSFYTFFVEVHLFFYSNNVDVGDTALCLD